MDKEYKEERDNKGYVEVNPVGEYYDEEAIPGDEYDEDYYLDDGKKWANEINAEPTLGGIYGLFKDVLHEPDSVRTSNLDKDDLELIRGRAEVALISDTFHHPGVGDFFKRLNDITQNTSMSRGGWFSELFISSRKHASRDSSSSISNLPQNQKPKKQKWRVFSSDNTSS